MARAEYEPYGEVIDAASPGTDMFRAKFTGKEWDEDSGLYYFDARYHDPLTGRFITTDSYLLGGPEANTASLNPYAYACNNPVLYTDPSGHDIFEDMWDGFAHVDFEPQSVPADRPNIWVSSWATEHDGLFGADEYAGDLVGIKLDLPAGPSETVTNRLFTMDCPTISVGDDFRYGVNVVFSVEYLK